MEKMFWFQIIKALLNVNFTGNISVVSNPEVAGLSPAVVT